MKFQRDTSPPRDTPTSLEVNETGADRAIDFGTSVCKSFDMADEAVPLLAGLASDPRWHLFVSDENDTPAGAGALFISGDKAWID